jgi:hypothetical protein
MAADHQSVYETRFGCGGIAAWILSRAGIHGAVVHNSLHKGEEWSAVADSQETVRKTRAAADVATE